MILVVGVVEVPTFVRLVRAEVRSLREHSYVEAGRAVGNSRRQILLRYIAPGTIGTMATQAAISCGWAIMLTAALGFIGLGVPLPEPEWGAMISDGVQEMVVGGRWWISFFPGLAIAITVFSLTLFGESVSDLADPTRRKSR